jgi:NAD(P)-dependent dehydrogenase (short-subunit alcohol dehydrogenase family)
MVREVTVITGASGGVGRAIASEFAARGHRLVLIARGQRGLDAAVAEAQQQGADATSLAVDVADAAAVQAAVDHIESEIGPIDLWVNVAFTSVFARFEEIEPAEYKRVTEVSYLGYVYATMAVLKHMKARNLGTIVQVGSSLAYRGIPLQTAYCGAKHAIQGFHEALRCELLHEGSGVHVTMVQLPAVNTPQFSWVLSRLPHQAQPVPPIYQPEVIARGVAYAAEHPKRREYWIGASTVATLLANAVAPGLLDRYLARTGFQAQQTPDPKPADQPANLWQPADGPDGRDFGAHGIFDDQAHTRSPQQWLSHHLGAVAAVGTAVGAAAVVAGRRLRR